jgi:hypothetical protein
MSELEDAMQEHAAEIIFTEHRPFSYSDFVPTFCVHGELYHIARGTFKNKSAEFVKNGHWELDYRTNQAFYTLKGHKFGNRKMTVDHTGVKGPAAIKCNPLYRWLSDLPVDRHALHNIRLDVHVEGIWDILSTSPDLKLDSTNKELRPQDKRAWQICGLQVELKITHKDSVNVIVGCSSDPIAVDLGGIIRATEALTRVEERVSAMVRECERVTARPIGKMTIPPYATWTVKMWHFGVDSLVTYRGQKFDITWQEGKEALLHIYSKTANNKNRSKIRLESQEYPRRNWVDAITEKLYLNQDLR